MNFKQTIILKIDLEQIREPEKRLMRTTEIEGNDEVDAGLSTMTTTPAQNNNGLEEREKVDHFELNWTKYFSIVLSRRVDWVKKLVGWTLK